MPHFVYEWENVTVEIVEKKGWLWKSLKRKKVLLDNGAVESNSLVAIIGTSGSGKSTLLRVLSGNLKGKNSTLKINRQIVKTKVIQGVCGYMRQTDVFTETLTILEHMRFMAALKLKTSKLERMAVITNILHNLGLVNLQQTCIRVLSGGERRRLSLATELIDDPNILLCDEPTTGLDSFTAMMIIEKLEMAALTGKIIVVTVHQPSSQLFSLFNNIILLANGKLIFQGTREETENFFNSQNLICPPLYNPADFYLKCLASDQTATMLSEVYKRQYQTSFHYETANDNLIFKTGTYERNIFFQLRWLMWRDFLDNRRDVSFLPAYFLVAATAILVAVSFSWVALDTISNVKSIQGVLYLVISELIYEQMYKVIYVFPRDVNIFVRDKSLYSPIPYYLSKLLSLIPCCVIYTLTHLSMYFLILPYLTGAMLFFKMFVILTISAISGAALGLSASAIFPNEEYVNIFLMPFQQVCMIFSGIWVKISTLSQIFAVLKNLSPFYFSYTAICNVYWLDVKIVGNCSLETERPCYKNGTDVLEDYGLSTSPEAYLWSMINLLILVCIFCYIGYIGIIRKRAVSTS